MSGFPTDCLTRTTIQPNSTILAGIEACQAAANTTFCYPPNGTRICAPAEDIPFYWPTLYYNSGSKLALDYEAHPWVLLMLNNTGNRTQDFTPFMYDSKATRIPGVQNEKTIDTYLLERRMNDEADPMNLKVHDGPTLILVKTAEWPTRTSASSRATATGKYHYDSDSDSDDDDKPRLHPGAIAGIVIGSIIAATALLFLCCRRCCCAAKQGIKIDKKEQAHIIEQGMELMEQKGAAAKKVSEEDKAVRAGVGLVDSRSGSEDISRVEEARIEQTRVDIESAYGGVPPPKYTP